jgi:hypothetical protein
MGSLSQAFHLIIVVGKRRMAWQKGSALLIQPQVALGFMVRFNIIMHIIYLS